jgi:hypothetical protein
MNVERLIETLEKVLSEQNGVKVSIELMKKGGDKREVVRPPNERTQ